MPKNMSKGLGAGYVYGWGWRPIRMPKDGTERDLILRRVIEHPRPGRRGNG